MVAMPYLLLGAFGLLVYRGLKQKAAAEARTEAPFPDEGDRKCSTPSTADDS